ncbi:MAG TPA: hypothetical protein VGK06_06390 [Methanosarcina sp.]
MSEGKLSSTVPRGERRSNPPDLPDIYMLILRFFAMEPYNLILPIYIEVAYDG